MAGRVGQLDRGLKHEKTEFKEWGEYVGSELDRLEERIKSLEQRLRLQPRSGVDGAGRPDHHLPPRPFPELVTVGSRPDDAEADGEALPVVA